MPMPLRTTARITALSPGQSPPPVRTPIRIGGNPSDGGSTFEVFLQSFDGRTDRATHRLRHAIWLYVGAVDHQRPTIDVDHINSAEMEVDRDGAADNAVLEATQLVVVGDDLFLDCDPTGEG